MGLRRLRRAGRGLGGGRDGERAQERDGQGEGGLHPGHPRRGSCARDKSLYAATGSRTRSRRIVGAPCRGLSVIARRRVSSCPPFAGCTSARSSTARSTTFISSVAKLAPMQRRRPPPNGIHV